MSDAMLYRLIRLLNMLSSYSCFRRDKKIALWEGGYPWAEWLRHGDDHERK